MINLKYFTLAVFIFCLISLISFGWSAEKLKVPSGTVGTPAVPAPAQSTPAVGIIPETKEIMPFNIRIDNQTSKYLNEFSLFAFLVPKNDSQAAKDAISGKTVTFYADGKIVGSGTSDIVGIVHIDISENWSRQLNLQVGTHTITAHTIHEVHVIKGNGILTVQKASARIDIQYIMPVSEAYTIGQTVTLGAILTTHSRSHPITNVNVDCIDIIKMNGHTTKTLKTVQTNNQGGFECPITLTQDLFTGALQCNILLGWIGASFENQNFMKTTGDQKILGCFPGMHPSNSCPPGCERVTGPPLCCQ
jgi:hypothetical protein